METDIEACFDQLPHCLIVDEVRRRVIDKRLLALVRSFLKAGVMTETGRLERTLTGTPQGGDRLATAREHRPLRARPPIPGGLAGESSYDGKRQDLRRKGHPTYRLVRYADDLVLMVMGTRAQAKALLEQLAGRVETLAWS